MQGAGCYRCVSGSLAEERIGSRPGAGLCSGAPGSGTGAAGAEFPAQSAERQPGQVLAHDLDVALHRLQARQEELQHVRKRIQQAETEVDSLQVVLVKLRQEQQVISCIRAENLLRLEAYFMMKLLRVYEMDFDFGDLSMCMPRSVVVSPLASSYARIHQMCACLSTPSNGMVQSS